MMNGIFDSGYGDGGDALGAVDDSPPDGASVFASSLPPHPTDFLRLLSLSSSDDLPEFFEWHGCTSTFKEQTDRVIRQLPAIYSQHPAQILFLAANSDGHVNSFITPFLQRTLGYGGLKQLIQKVFGPYYLLHANKYAEREGVSDMNADVAAIHRDEFTGPAPFPTGEQAAVLEPPQPGGAEYCPQLQQQQQLDFTTEALLDAMQQNTQMQLQLTAQLQTLFQLQLQLQLHQNR
eukprot:gnl/Hemi2/13269_TR4544_c0_g1_i2.p2 gnl/Hemi2/13269_TR4544_c0_g1~~gnl/Hemi2/13269_TR4544_c0_g1_i2.p2  ORF type:complete len:234 (+),score=50.74 gnl/Hemi2/13269_TR4544_c0_g1_i2:105-806(+)